MEKVLCTERLLNVLNALVELKNRIHGVRTAVAYLQKRSDQVVFPQKKFSDQAQICNK